MTEGSTITDKGAKGYQKPEKTVVKAWRLRRLITLLLWAVVLAAAIVIYRIAGTQFAMLPVCVGIGLLVCYKLIGLFVYPAIEYKQWRYLISDEKVEIIHGIFFIKRDIIPVVRIQNITVKQGPIYRRYGLHTAEIALASGTFEIEGLSGETAEDIAEKMRERLHIRLQNREEA